MAHKTADRILESSTSVGLGAFALEGAVDAYRPFSAAGMAEGDTCHYMINAVDSVGRPTGLFELGRATMTGAALARTLVIASSNAGAAVDFPEGAKQIGLTILSASTDQLKADWQEALGLDQTGMVCYFAQSTPPAGYLKRNGAAVSRTTYARLFAKIGTTYGAGDGSATFNLPDGRGVFDRGLDEGRGLDPGRALGSYQDSANLSHTHGVSDSGHGHSIIDPGHAHGVADPGHAHGAWTDAQGSHAHGYLGTAPAYVAAVTPIGYGFSTTETGRGTDPVGNHGHNVGVGASGTGIGIYAAATGIGIKGDHANVSVLAIGETEARPRNNAYLACIKY
ncbi:phage tail protein [Variovorax sp. GB1P17]|uniref:phage tail protein n=1 Tax=Variovorax sp. GB1P17 TaxID=3443740 RepID=UPI003F481E96